MRVSVAIVFFSVILGISISCQRSKSEQINAPAIANTIESFNEFIHRFYTDTSFQQDRILIPLEGEISEWHETKDSVVVSSWTSREIIISDFKDIQSSLQNTIQAIEEFGDTTIEKIYIENSGFILERTFTVIEGKWYLSRYDIENL